MQPVNDKKACTMCLSCVNACPASALAHNVQAPQLNLSAQRKEHVLLNEMQPYACVSCGKAFGTLKGIEAMLGKLSGHSMFQGAALERLKMCGDCRVVDIYSADNEIKITDLKS